MTNIDELQKRRDELMEKIISARPYNNIERGANFSELKRLTAEMLEALRDGQPEEKSDDKGMLWSQQDKLRLRVISLEAQVDNQERCIEGLRAWANDVDSAIEDELAQRVASIEHLRQLDREEQDRFRDAIWKRIAELHKAVKRLEDKPTPPHLSFSELQKHVKEFEEDIGRHFKVLAEQFGDLRHELDERVGKTENEVVNQGARITLLRDEMKALERNKVNAWADKTWELERRVKQLRAWADDVDSAVSQLYRHDDKLHARLAKLEVEAKEAAAYDDMLERMDAGRKADEQKRQEWGDALKRAIADADSDADEAKPAPCPYCGSDNWEIPVAARYAVYCIDCGARGSLAESRTAAKAKWNAVAGTTPADCVPADVVRALNDAAAAAFDVIDSAVERGHVNNATIYEQDWGTLRDELGEARYDVDNALAGRKAAQHG